MFIFYDTETSGLNEDFSQILQIALVFTDDNMNILSSKKVECRRSPWIIPAPGAMLITGFSPDDLKNAKLSHFEMMQDVHDWIKSQHWPVIFSGYNTLGYDEPVFAQNLYQNLLPQRLTTAPSASGEKNGRCDIMAIVKATFAYAPGALTLEKMSEINTPSFALGNVAEQNGVNLSSEDAHDAMNDIRATVGVAKMLQKTVPHIWEQMLKLSSLDGVNEFIAANKIFTHTYIARGEAKAIAATEVADGLFCNLSIDPATYIDKSAAELKQILWQKGMVEFRKVDKESQPILMPVDQSDAVLPKDYDDAVYTARADLIRNHPDFAAKLKEAYALKEADIAAKKKPPATPLPELMIEQVLPADTQTKLERWMQDFRNAADWKESAAIMNDFYVRFEKELPEQGENLRRFVKLAGRIIFEHAPEELGAEKLALMQVYVATRALNPDPDAPYLTIPKARLELETIEQERAQGKAKWQHVTDSQIRSLKLYYTALEKEYAPHFPKSQPGPANGNNPPQKKAGGLKP